MVVGLTCQILVEKSLLGWKEYELGVMRDRWQCGHHLFNWEYWFNGSACRGVYYSGSCSDPNRL